jgi:hypothetical protein
MKRGIRPSKLARCIGFRCRPKVSSDTILPAGLVLSCAISFSFVMGCRAVVTSQASASEGTAPQDGACGVGRTGPVQGVGCTTIGPVTCTAQATATIPPGPIVTIAAGVGCPPTPKGGPVTAGHYALVAEAVYGAYPPHTEGRAGDTTQAELNVACDEYDVSKTVWSSQTPGDSAYTLSCGRLVPQAASLVDLSINLSRASPTLRCHTTRLTRRPIRR